MIRASDKDLATLRAGMRVEIERDVREEVTRESIARLMDRKTVREVQLVQAVALEVGDVIASCDGGSFFYEDGTIEAITPDHDGQPVAGDMWLTVRDPRGGLYGTAKRNADTILRKVPLSAGRSMMDATIPKLRALEASR